MNINNYDYVEPKGLDGKIILTHFPGRKGEEKLFNYKIFIEYDLIYKMNPDFLE